jgi:hypothetical protein
MASHALLPGFAALFFALGLLGACSPVLEEALPNGDHVVTTYGRLRGIEGTKWDNREAALTTCPDGYLVLNERLGRDSEGLYRRWEYGCLAPQ